MLNSLIFSGSKLIDRSTGVCYRILNVKMWYYTWEELEMSNLYNACRLPVLVADLENQLNDGTVVADTPASRILYGRKS